ncbi:hypothetical protein GGS23DRAFT_594573 [Durotheca rogersii]|uniref:uncharacterized protein n=1 Tax=Durotheca rogersii TaxID=419775 RepID=UPI00221FD121|nr:uncharacterized protein GGS23DRAFT_594573 [Durotheca rogersii]KAI5865015.1 hypothetical protein GGS23DRAFT_594573 [Durotheca rogersii]
MLPRQQYSAVLCAVLFGSLVSAQQFQQCITNCVRQSGCSPTDLDCMCEKASGNFLTEVVVCMNQWCSAKTSLSELLDPIQANCDVPKSAIQNAQSKAGFDTGSSTTTKASPTTETLKSEEPKVSTTGGVGAPVRVDSTTVTKGTSPTSALISDTTAVVTQTPDASAPLLVASSTLTTVPSSATTGSSSSSSSGGSSDSTNSDNDNAQVSSDGSPAGASTQQGTGATEKASLLAAVLAVATAMAFGW